MKISKESVIRAKSNIEPWVAPTDMLYSEPLSARAQGPVYLKLENLQPTGSFKVRGAFQVLGQLGREERRRGVIAPTAGNHGMGLAFAGKKLGIPVHICLPCDADPIKLSFMRECGADITFFDDIETARQKALEASRNQRMTFISAYNNVNMVLGGGTIGAELLDQLPEADIVLVPVGGGGLASGVGAYVKQINPGIQVVAVQAENSPTFFEWFKARKAILVNLRPSIATGLSGYIEPETLTLPLFLDVVDQVVTVSETDIMSAMEWVLNTHKMVVEPSGVVAVAALLSGKLDTAGKTVVLILTGSNISKARLNDLIRPPQS